MRKYLLSVLTCTTFLFGANAQKTGHKIKFNIKDLTDSTVYIARYYGGKQYMVDTIQTGGKEKFVYEGEKTLDCGLYMFVREKKDGFFDFIINKQHFSISTDTANLRKNISFKGSKENEQLYEYIEFNDKLNKVVTRYNKEIKEFQKSGEKEKELAVQAKLNSANDSMKTYMSNFMKENPDHFLNVVFGITKEIEFPKGIDSIKPGETKKDADRRKYLYYLEHYFDHVDFSSPCLLRTPTFHNKLQQYFDKFVPQHYDSIPKYADIVIEKARANEENFKYVLNYLTFKWETGKEKRMCWDAVFQYLAKKYYMTGQTPWVDLVQMEKIKERANALEPCLCGREAVPFQMKYKNFNFPPGLYDTSNVYYDFRKYDKVPPFRNLKLIDEDYVVLWFWDSDCGHCKKQTPKLWDTYQKYKKQGKSIEVYAINLENESKGYKKYLREKKYNWINVQDTFHLSKFREHYDIYSTPVLFLLDKDRKIIAKKIDPEGLDRILEQLFQEAEEKKKIKQEGN